MNLHFEAHEQLTVNNLTKTHESQKLNRQNSKFKWNNLSKHGCFGDVKLRGQTKLDGQKYFGVNVANIENNFGRNSYCTNHCRFSN